MYNVFTDDRLNTNTLPRMSSLLNLSIYRQFYSPVLFRSFSIKYVIEGCEKYTVNDRPYHLTTGQYLLANHFSEGFVEIESKKHVRGICIDISPKVISEVVGSFVRPDTAYSDLCLDTFFNTNNFLENQYDSTNTNLGQLLKSIEYEISKNPFYAHEFSEEFYYNLAESIVLDQLPKYKELQNVPALKPETRKELLRRVSKGKSFIDEHFRSNIDVAQIAKEAQLSEYHFFRLFKAIYGISPNQYLIRKKLDFAIIQLKCGGKSVTDISIDSGFSDIYAFSKCFKKHQGASPSLFLP
ncbi:MAG: helix-turn-helix transcriptional regulator [Saprospiraceae bacterium]|nr:helix-turn-helix transcriptional regulator [Saprospiraceae bacterium]